MRGTTADSADIVMETVVCNKCGQRFAFLRDPVDHSTDLTRKQASWVEEQLVWDHIQERKHRGSIKLPKL
jgi:hypothetical protein